MSALQDLGKQFGSKDGLMTIEWDCAAMALINRCLWSTLIFELRGH